MQIFFSELINLFLLFAVCKEPQYKVEESGYAGFLMPIEVYFKNKVRYLSLFLQLFCPLLRFCLVISIFFTYIPSLWLIWVSASLPLVLSFVNFPPLTLNRQRRVRRGEWFGLWSELYNVKQLHSRLQAHPLTHRLVICICICYVFSEKHPQPSASLVFLSCFQ